MAAGRAVVAAVAAVSTVVRCCCGRRGRLLVRLLLGGRLPPKLVVGVDQRRALRGVPVARCRGLWRFVHPGRRGHGLRDGVGVREGVAVAAVVGGVGVGVGHARVVQGGRRQQRVVAHERVVVHGGHEGVRVRQRVRRRHAVERRGLLRGVHHGLGDGRRGVGTARAVVHGRRVPRGRPRQRRGRVDRAGGVGGCHRARLVGRRLGRWRVRLRRRVGLLRFDGVQRGERGRRVARHLDVLQGLERVGHGGELQGLRGCRDLLFDLEVLRLGLSGRRTRHGSRHQARGNEAWRQTARRQSARRQRTRRERTRRQARWGNAARRNGSGWQ